MRGRLLMTLIFFSSIFHTNFRSVLFTRSAALAEVNNYSTDQQRDIYNTFDSEDQSDKGLPVDPFDLMNRLKKAGAMKNATTPSDALDEALSAFDETEYENVPNK